MNLELEQHGPAIDEWIIEAIEDEIPAGETIEKLKVALAQLQDESGAQNITCTFDRDLYFGLTGSDIQCLQTYLSTTGHFTLGYTTNYFGPITRAAVSAWQTDNGVYPTHGYFGPISRTKYEQVK